MKDMPGIFSIAAFGALLVVVLPGAVQADDTATDDIRSDCAAYYGALYMSRLLSEKVANMAEIDASARADAVVSQSDPDWDSIDDTMYNLLEYYDPGVDAFGQTRAPSGDAAEFLNTVIDCDETFGFEPVIQVKGE
ncbi:hypothetical protein GCM10011342_25200 [Aquisalinus flavus]|uniref:Uncharacterized protein n=2 Tax=Aquisalinus flavus TaxID=1526572 RepID=A0A8J2V5S1_9PROT|nr:hypothetical protein GCM10011342_25200 [Aquisalinus flavus]